LIGVKEETGPAAHRLPIAVGEKTMTLYLAGVIAAFTAFGVTLFAVSVWNTLKP